MAFFYINCGIFLINDESTACCPGVAGNHPKHAATKL